MSRAREPFDRLRAFVEAVKELRRVYRDYGMRGCEAEMLSTVATFDDFYGCGGLETLLNQRRKMLEDKLERTSAHKDAENHHILRARIDELDVIRIYLEGRFR